MGTCNSANDGRKEKPIIGTIKGNPEYKNPSLISQSAANPIIQPANPAINNVQNPEQTNLNQNETNNVPKEETNQNNMLNLPKIVEENNESVNEKSVKEPEKIQTSQIKQDQEMNNYPYDNKPQTIVVVNNSVNRGTESVYPQVSVLPDENNNNFKNNNSNNNNNNFNNENNNNYYLVCPDCKERSPHIDKINYDNNKKDFVVRYSCVCNQSPHNPTKIALLLELLSNKEPINLCLIHKDNKLIYYCKNCHKGICELCKINEHQNHSIESNNKPISKEEADRMLETLIEKENEFKDKLNDDEIKIENGIDNAIEKLNQEKMNYKKQMENYKTDNQKKFEFLKTLYTRYKNELDNGDNGGAGINMNKDIMLANHINKFAIVDNAPKLNTNVDEILNNYEKDTGNKNLELVYDYGFPKNVKSSLEASYAVNNSLMGRKENNNVWLPNNNEMDNDKVNLKSFANNDYNFNNNIKKDPFNYPNDNYNLNKNNINNIGEEYIDNSRDITNSELPKQSVNNNIPSIKFHCTKSLIGHNDKIVSLIKLNSGCLASGSYDNQIKIWNITTQSCIRNIKENGYVLSLLEFENNMLLSGTSENDIHLWDISSNINVPTHNFSGHQLWVNCLVKCDDNYFASASNDANIRIWDYYEKKCTSILQGHVDCILSLILLQNGNLCSGSADLTIKIWDWRNKFCKVTLKGHEKWVKCVYELDNEILLSGSDDKLIKVWKNENCIKTIRGHKHSVRTFCQINQNYFASGSFDKTIKIWDANTYELFQELVDHTSNVICLIKLKENCLASCSNDKTIKIWEGDDMKKNSFF